MSAPRFLRAAPDGAVECLTICRLEEGELYSEAIAREAPYVVQVTAGSLPGDDFVGIYDLDGERIDTPCAWEDADDAPEDVIEAVEEGWATGLLSVERLREAS